MPARWMRSPPRSTNDALIEEHAYAHLLEPWHHCGAVVIAEDAVDRPLECDGDRRELGKRMSEGTKRLSPEVAGDDTEIVVE